MTVLDEIFLAKAVECLEGAGSEHANGRYNNCANRCYYACFQAAVCALMQAGVRSPSESGSWSHAFVQAEFAGVLVDRRKLFPGELRDVLTRTMLLRQSADYGLEQVSEVQASRALRRARTFVGNVQTRGGERA